VLAARHVTMISIGGIMGAGLFVGSSVTINAAGPAVVLSYLMAGILVLLVMRMLGEMAIALPQVRTFSDFARKGIGEWAGFVVGWLYWYFWIVVVPVEAIAGAQLLQIWIHLPAWLLGVGLMAIMTGVNLLSARSYGEFEFWFALIKVTAVVAFILLAAAWAFGLTSSGVPTWSNLVSGGGFAPRGVVSVLAAVTSVFFAIVGAEITVVAAAESREPVRAVARMSTAVMTRILIFYVGSVLLIVTVVPWQQIVPGKSPFTAAMNTEVPGEVNQAKLNLADSRSSALGRNFSARMTSLCKVGIAMR
jgi:GABA permease